LINDQQNFGMAKEIKEALSMTARNLFWKCLLLILLGVVPASCTPADSERCGSDEYFEDGACYLKDAGGHDTGETPNDAGGDDAGGDDAGGNDGLPTGLGEVCAGEDGCAGFEADYCAQRPGEATGYCTIENCTGSPDNCPGDYTCCLFIVADNFCATAEDIEAMGPMCEE
jgi:hypothetical protein